MPDAQIDFSGPAREYKTSQQGMAFILALSLLFILPWAVPSIPTIMSLCFMLNPEWGVINTTWFRLTFEDGPNWLNDPTLALSLAKATIQHLTSQLEAVDQAIALYFDASSQIAVMLVERFGRDAPSIIVIRCSGAGGIDRCAARAHHRGPNELPCRPPPRRRRSTIRACG